ncbi:MAG TPA: Ig-like domain repeat protein [bacterium]|nr:Ig-like domain repeat protein [bacterium]
MGCDHRTGESAAAWRDYRDEGGYTVDFGWDEWGDVYSNYMGTGYPTTVVIDCQEPPIVVWTRVGRCDDTGCAQNLRDQIETDWLPLCNSDPELSTPSFDPTFGRTDTDFNFYIDYYDDEGDAPASIVVYVNDVPHGMFLDTGDPDNGTYVWTGTIAQEGLATFYFTANDGRGGTARFPGSGELDGPYVYDDYNPPSSSCSAPARSQSNNITVDYTSSDDKSGVSSVDLWMQCNGGGYSLIDSSSSQNGSFNVTLASGNGIYDFYTRATDIVGNEEDPPGSPDASTIYDDMAPDSLATAGIVYYWKNLPVQVDFTADDNLSGVDSTVLWYRHEGGAWTNSGLSEGGVAGTFDFYAPQGQGAYAFYTIATDLNGNVENPPAASQANVLYDATKPVSSCTSTDETNAVSVDVDFTASDNDQLDQTALWYQYEGGAWTGTGQTNSAGSGTFTFTFAAGDGVYGFYTIAQDMAGNVEDAPAAADTTVNLDQTMPESSCTADPLVSEVPFDVHFTASDAGTGVASTKLWYRFAGETQWRDSYQSLAGVSGTFSLDPIALTPQLGDGDYELITIATDNVGNKEAPPGIPDATVLLDRTSPLSSVDCISQTTASPLALNYSANDSLSGIAKVALWYSFDGGDWADSGLFDTFGTSGYSVSAESGTFQFVFPHGDGVYDFMSLATDAAGNVEVPGAADCTCTFDTTPPVSSGQTGGVVNDPTIAVTFSSADDYTGISDVHLFYRYTDLNGVIDDTLRDTGRYSEEASGQFVWAPDMGPGYYNFYVAATDGAGNVEGTDGDADATCLYDPRFALSSMDAPGYVTEPTVPITFGVDIGNDGYDHVTLYYRYGATLGDADSASWITTSTVSTDPSGAFDFSCADGDGFYQFFTRATSGSWIMEPIPETPDATTLYDGIAPETSVSATSISPGAQFNLTYTTVEDYGLVKIDIYYCYQGTCYLFTTVHDTNGTVVFNTQGNEGVYEFYTIGTDTAGNVEGIPPGGYDCAVAVDLLPPQSVASVDAYGTGFPIEVTFGASDTVTQVTNVALWVKFEDGGWVDTGLSGVGELGTLDFTPASALEGTYYFYTVASDEAGHTEAAPAAPDDQITIDWTAPQTSCDSPEFTNDTTVPVTYTASDAVSGMSSVSGWIYTGGAWQDTGLVGPANGGVINVDVSAWGEGTFGFCTVGRDNSGNVEALPSEPVTTTLYDATEPTSAAGLPTEGVFANTTPINVPYTADDSASGLASVSLWFKFDGGLWEDSGLTNVASGLSVMADGSFSFEAPHGDGTYEFATRALDNAGNLESLPESPDGGALVFDQTAPTSSVAFEGTYAIAFPVTLPFTAADTTSGIASVALYVSLDGGAYEDTALRATGTEGSFDYTPETLVAGVYRFYAIATDNAGNAESVPGEPDATVIFDTVAPVSVASVSAEYTNSFR